MHSAIDPVSTGQIDIFGGERCQLPGVELRQQNEDWAPTSGAEERDGPVAVVLGVAGVGAHFSATHFGGWDDLKNTTSFWPSLTSI